MHSRHTCCRCQPPQPSLQQTATHCNTPQYQVPAAKIHRCVVERSQLPQPSLKYTAAHCNALQYQVPAAKIHRCVVETNDINPHCNTLQHTATPCNTMRPTATHCNTRFRRQKYTDVWWKPTTATLTATQCNTLQHTATTGSGGKDTQVCGGSQRPQPLQPPLPR